MPRGADQPWARAPRMRRCRRTRRKAAQEDLRSVADTSGNVDDLPRCAWRAVPCRRVSSLGGEYVFLWENEGHRCRAFVPGWASLSGLWATTAGGCALEFIFSRNHALCPASRAMWGEVDKGTALRRAGLFAVLGGGGVGRRTRRRPLIFCAFSRARAS